MTVAGLSVLPVLHSPRADAPGGLSKAAPAGDEEEPEDEEDEEEDDEDEDETESAGDEEDETEEENGMSVKSQVNVSEADFQKSLDRLEAEANTGNQETRRSALLAKAQSGDLDPEERDELFAIMGGGDTANKSLGSEVTEGLNSNETLQKAYDVSDFLAEHNLELTKSLDLLSAKVEAQDNRQHEFNLVLAKAMVDTGKLIKAMSERLGVIASQPAREPKARGAQPLQKSMVGGSLPPEGDNLSKSQIQDALDDMMQKSVDSGNQGVSPGGMDIAVETAKFEMSNKLSPKMFAEVRQHLKARG